MSDFGEPDDRDNRDAYATFHDNSGDQKDFRDDEIRGLNQSKKQVPELGEFYPPVPDDDNDALFDVFKVTDDYYNTGKPSKSPIKKEIPLEQFLCQTELKLSQKSSIENKNTGLKQLNQRLKDIRNSSWQRQTLCNWFQKIRIVDNFFHQDSHPQILRNIAPVLKFIYENNRFNLQQISLFAFVALHSNQDYLIATQQLISFLKIEDLKSIFELVCREAELQNNNFACILSSIVSNKAFMEQELAEKQADCQIKNNTLSQQYEIQNIILPPSIQIQTEEESECGESLQNAKQLTISLFQFLNTAAQTQMNTFCPILNKLISTKHVFLGNQIFLTLSQLIKASKIHYIWILQHCLKIQGQNNKGRGKQGNKLPFIGKLISEHLYEYLLVTLAKVRFNKTFVDRILSIFIMLSKIYKPLDEVYMQFTWKILGLNSKQEKQRQQFFNFVRDILRNQSNLTEQSVYFIFFQVLMSLQAEWFSLKILDCLQLLFMRLNEDLKLISYTDQSYEIIDEDLVGLDKFWYIYFNSNDYKVTKKCREFLYKLTTFKAKSSIKTTLYEEYSNKIIHHMNESENSNKIDFCTKGFEIIDRLCQSATQTDAKRVAVTQNIHMIIKNQCSDAVGLRKMDMKLSQKCRLDILREHISGAINPNNTKIQLLAKGQILKGQKMTLKELGLENGVTILVFDDDQIKYTTKQTKSSVIQNMINQLTQIFGSQFENNFLKYIVQKMEGHKIDTIIEAIMSQEKLQTMKIQFEENDKKQSMIQMKNQGQGEKNEQKNMKNAEQNDELFNFIPNQSDQQGKQSEITRDINFSLVFSTSSAFISQLLKLAGISNKKRGWETIKKLPINQIMLSEAKKKLFFRQFSQLFPQEQFDQMLSVYTAHLLKNIIQAAKKPLNITTAGINYLLKRASKLLINYNNVLLSEIMQLLACELEQNCTALSLFKKRLQKPLPQNLLEVFILQAQNPIEKSHQVLFDQVKWLLSLLQAYQQSSPQTVVYIAQVLLYFVLENTQCVKQFLDIQSNQLHWLISYHGVIGQYIVLTVLSRIWKQIESNSQNALAFCNKIFTLLDCPLPNIPNTSMSRVSLFSISNHILRLTNSFTHIQDNLINSHIKRVRKQAENISGQQMLVIFLLLKLCITKNYGKQHISTKMQNEFQQLCFNKPVQNTVGVPNRLNEQILYFGKWLFSQFLFNLTNPSYLIRDKNIRKISYEILQLISSHSQYNKSILTELVIQIPISAQKKDEDYTDFRATPYIGLINLGATCYFNSLIQQLFCTKFSKILLQSTNCNDLHSQIPKLKQIFMDLFLSIKSVVNPREFIKSINFYGEPINTSVQQDASQFLLCLFDLIESTGYKKQVEQVFGGNVCNEVTVGQGPIYVKNRVQHFNFLGIDIKGKKNLQDALVYMIKAQTLDGDNKYYCQQLGKKMKASQRSYIQSLPNILILTLKRFQFNYDSQSRQKLNDYFQFPLELDLHRYSANWVRNKKQDSPDSKYRLCGILVHSGSAQSGHYYSYIKIGQQWFEFNDRQVTQFNIVTNLKNQCFGCPDGKKNRSAYMLFYEKTSTNYHGAQLSQISIQNHYKNITIQQNSLFLKNRLIYDHNFKKYLQCLSTQNSPLQNFMWHIFGKPKSQQEYIQNTDIKLPIKNNSAMVYYDVEADVEVDQQNKPLLLPNYADNDLFDQLLNKD